MNERRALQKIVSANQHSKYLLTLILVGGNITGRLDAAAIELKKHGS